LGGAPADVLDRELGPYRLRNVLGEGGMGTVYLAEQVEPVRRKVALKIIKAGLDCRKVIARFEAERQALALMDHNHIARVYDAGMTGGGLPYFAMELVQGQSITTYCDQNRLPVRQRLELFVMVCRAVQHAHQKGVIHRDLKPSNILVAVEDGRPAPKVIDFGIAKATGDEWTESITQTGMGAPGTLEYMSPEQASPSQAGIDTRTDVYSLGVVLYELLTGVRPIDADRSRQAGWIEMVGRIRDEEPTRPSTRLSTVESSDTLAAARQTDPRRLSAALRGDLDWITMKCLEKDRNRRYDSADALGRDLERFLADEPVEARPPSTAYRAGKFLARHKGAVLAASLVVVALLAGMIGTSYGLVRAQQQRRAAVGAQRAAEAESRRAERERRTAERFRDKAELEKTNALDAQQLAQKRLRAVEESNKILGSVFGNLNPHAVAEADTPLEVLLIDQLNRAAEQLEGDAIGDPLAVAEMQVVLGNSLRNLGQYEKALDLFRKALATRQAELGERAPETLASMMAVCGACLHCGRLDEARQIAQRALILHQDVYRSDHELTIAVQLDLATIHLRKQEYQLAEPLLKQALESGRKAFKPDDMRNVLIRSGLATLFQQTQRLEEAVPLFEEVLDALRLQHGSNHPVTYVAKNNLATAYWHTRQLDKSIPLLEELLEQRTKTLGPDHPERLIAMANLGINYKEAGRIEDALPLLAASYRAADKVPMLRGMAKPLFEVYVAAQKDNEAAALAQVLLAGIRAQMPPRSWEIADQLQACGRQLLQAKAYAAAEPLLRECAAIREELRPDDWQTYQAKIWIGQALLDEGKLEDAEPLLLAGYEGLQQRQAKISPSDASVLTGALELLVRLYRANGQDAKAELWQQRASGPRP
jgi:tetratricopeptide (TPR) repeat protein